MTLAGQENISYSQMLSSLIARRAGLAVSVDAADNRWQKVAMRLSELGSALSHLAQHQDAGPQLRQAFEQLPFRELNSRIGEVQQQLRGLAARFGRRSITVAVSGQARVGKSLLLQSISGLGDDQIPVASGRPVTAVPIRITHTTEVPRAEALLHSESTFLCAHVLPFHRELKLSLPPDLATFAAFPYPPEEQWQVDSQRVLLVRLKQTQAALRHYRDLLTGGRLAIGLDQIRGYVAYPTQQEEQDGTAQRRYLAIREMRIESPFHHADAGCLNLVDLPGLGEAVPDAERNHLAALRDQVDAVIMMKRPVEGLAYWTNADVSTLHLLEEARGQIRLNTDFVLMMVNKAEFDAPQLAQALEQSLVEANISEPDRSTVAQDTSLGGSGERYTVLRTDASDPDQVAAQVLVPLLDHLTSRLERMDRDLLQAAAADAQQVEAAIRGELSRLGATISEVRGRTAVPAESLDEQAGVLHESLAVALQRLVTELRAEAQLEFDDEGYVAAVERASCDIRTWIRRGLGGGEDSGPGKRSSFKQHLSHLSPADGEDPQPEPEQLIPWTLDEQLDDPLVGPARRRWLEQAYHNMVVHKSAAPLAATELSRIRVHISQRFSDIDLYFHDRVLRLHERVVEAIRKPMGSLLPAVASARVDLGGTPDHSGAEKSTERQLDATEQLRQLRRKLLDGYEPCPDLAGAVSDLLAIRLDYRTQLHPLVRSSLNELELQVFDPVAQCLTTQISVEVSEDGTQELYDFLCMRAEQATFDTAQALISRSIVPALVMFTAAEQFDDSLIRSGRAKQEFKRFARTYQNELWPEWSTGLASDHARFAAVSRACAAVEAALKETR
jgi:hypothetical protein